jgi:hypothetical protein
MSTPAPVHSRESGMIASTSGREQATGGAARTALIAQVSPVPQGAAVAGSGTEKPETSKGSREQEMGRRSTPIHADLPLYLRTSA